MSIQREHSNTRMVDDGSDFTIEPGLIDKAVRRAGVEELASKPFLDYFLEEVPDDQPPVIDKVGVQRAFKHTYAVEREGGTAVVGAIRIDSGSMSMYDKDQLLPHIHMFAALLSSLPDNQRGMMVDVPRSVDYTTRRERARKHLESLEAQIDNLTESSTPESDAIEGDVPESKEELDDLSYRELQKLAKERDIKANQRREEMTADLVEEMGLPETRSDSESGESSGLDDDPKYDEMWRLQMQADIAEERCGVENFYQKTSSNLEHYIVLEVSELDAARAVSGVDGGLADLEFIGRPIKERRVDKLKAQSDLTPLMVRTLNKRLKSLEQKLTKLHGIEATAISSAEYTEVIADAYRPDDVSRIKNFQDLVRRSPAPTADGREATASDPVYAIHHHEDNSEDLPNTTDYASEQDVKNQYRQLVAPDDMTEESDGAITINGTQRSATIAITGWPEVPPSAFLEELYKYSQPGVEITTALHFKRLPDDKAQREAKRQQNSLEDRLDGAFGTLFEDYVKRKYEEAEKFTKSIEKSKYSTFEAGLYVTIEASTLHQNDETGEIYESDDRLDSALEDVELILKEDCGFDVRPMDDRQEDGWQTSIPIANNQLGENVKLRADAIARKWPYQYKNREDPEGIKVGLHDYLRETSAIDFYGLENGHNIGLYGTIGAGKTTTFQELANAFKQYHDAEDLPFKMILGTPLRDHESLCDVYGGNHRRIGADAAVNPLAVHYVPPDRYRNLRDGSPWKGFIQRFDTFLSGYYTIMNRSGLGDKRDTWMRAGKYAQRRHGIERGKPETYKNKSAIIPEVIDIFEEMVDDPKPFIRESLHDDDKTIEQHRKIARDILIHDVEPFEEDGIYSHFCERSELNLLDHDVIFLDFRDQEGDESAGGLEMMMRLSDLHEQQKNFMGRTFIGIDEFHYMLTNPQSADFFKRLHRHSRHWNLSVCLATQEFGDLWETVTDDNGNESQRLSETAKVIFNNQPVQFYHYTKEMDAEWAQKLGLTNRSENFISDADTGEKTEGYAQALMVVDETQYPLRIEMSDEINPRQFAVYQHDPRKHPPLREFLRNYTDSEGRDVCNWRWN